MKKFTRQEVQFVQERASERIDEIFDALGIDYRERNDYIQCACPVHEGDNPRSLYWAIQSSHWKCMTKHCEQEQITGPSNSVFGLVRGTMSQKTGHQWGFQRAVAFVAKVLNLQLSQMDDETEADIEINKAIKEHKKRQQNKYDKEETLLVDVLPMLQPDDVYYPSRGISKETIDRYHISFCGQKGKPFFQRAFFPVLDETGRVVAGWSGRSVWEQCSECQMYHGPMMYCPDDTKRGIYVKWKHSKGFRSEQHLYNYWYAKPFIAKFGSAIVCESPGNCWALDAAGIKNSVAMFGLSMSNTQRQLLQKAGALTLVFVLDNDEPGKQAIERLSKDFGYYFRLFFITPEDVNDVGDMVPEEINNQIGSILKTVSRESLLRD